MVEQTGRYSTDSHLRTASNRPPRRRRGFKIARFECMKLDRTVHTTYGYENQPIERSHYAGMSIRELAAVFQSLQRSAFQMDEYPAMDKSVFSSR